MESTWAGRWKRALLAEGMLGITQTAWEHISRRVRKTQGPSSAPALPTARVSLWNSGTPALGCLL